LCSALLCLSFGGTACLSLAASNARTQQKTQAEAARAELQQKLKALKTDINKTENAKDHANDALAESEQAISEADRSLRDLQDEQIQTEDKLKQLLEQQLALKTQVEKQKRSSQRSCAVNICVATAIASNCCSRAITLIASTEICNTWVMCRKHKQK